MSKKEIEITLEENLLYHLDKDYAALIFAIKTTQKVKTIDLANTIFRVVRHAKIKKNDKNNADVKILTINAH